MHKTTLIIGGLGYLGGRIAQSLLATNKYKVIIGTRKNQEDLPKQLAGCDVVLVDLLEKNSIQKSLKDVDIIIHLAAMNANESANNPNNALLVNGLGTLNLLNAAKKMGVTRAVNVQHESLKDAMNELGMNEGFDIGLEMSGVPSAFTQMLDTMNHGGKIAMLGIPPDKLAIDWNKVIFKGLTIKGIYGREMFETWYKMASLIQSGLDLTPIITHQYTVDDFQKGFDLMISGQCGKVVLDWS